MLRPDDCFWEGFIRLHLSALNGLEIVKGRVMDNLEMFFRGNL